MSLENCHDWICPDLRDHWELVRVSNAGQYLLRSLDLPQRWVFSLQEGYALRFFTGRYTVNQVQSFSQQAFPMIESGLIVKLIAKLVERNILSISQPESDLSTSPQLKVCVQWFRLSDGYWILRNPEDVKWRMQVRKIYKAAIARRQQPNLWLMLSFKLLSWLVISLYECKTQLGGLMDIDESNNKLMNTGWKNLFDAFSPRASVTKEVRLYPPLAGCVTEQKIQTDTKI